MSTATLADIVRDHARARPRAPALAMDEAILTYEDLDRRANRVANGLVAAGVQPGARIALLAKNGLEFFELLFGAIKAGAVLVPVNFRLAPPEVAYVVNDAQAALFFVGRDFHELAAQIRGELQTVRTLYAVDGGHAGWESYATWRDRHGALEPGRALAADDIAVQMYTSGTTGRPKGAQLTHANFMQLLPRAIGGWGHWRASDSNLVCMPLFHIAGSGWGLVGLYAGACNVVLREVDPKAILSAIARHRVTKALFVPAVILFLLQQPDCAQTDFSSLELVVYGASPIPLELLQRALQTFGCAFAQVYGLTETTGAITYLPPEDHRADRAERMKSCGRPHGGIELRIVDPSGRTQPPRVIGEVVCRSAQIMKGYWNLPKATASCIREGWFHTGDAGYLDEDGYLYIYDRVKDMIVTGGENVYPAEVEGALFGHPAVADVAVIGVPDEKWGEAVKAVVVKKPGTEVTEAELIAFARSRIGGYKLPKSVDFVASLPRNPSGKLLKRELRKPYWEGRERQVN
jgi:acyl-CoA synthetase (AMP-forming)/AMP-acid ligase II